MVVMLVFMIVMLVFRIVMLVFQNDCVDDGHPAFLAFWCEAFGSL